MVGSGTSGRLSFAAARSFRELAEARDLGTSLRFHYAIAGGDGALIKAQESGEDDPAAGARAVESCLADAPANATVVVIGITCGLSAPYVAGALDRAVADPDRLLRTLSCFERGG